MVVVDACVRKQQPGGGVARACTKARLGYNC